MSCFCVGRGVTPQHWLLAISLLENGSKTHSPNLMAFLFGKLILFVSQDYQDVLITMVANFIFLPCKAKCCVKTLMTIIIVILTIDKKKIIIITKHTREKTC